MGKLSHGDIEHVDLGFYFLHCNANHQHQKVFMKRKDAADCQRRLECMWPLVPEEQIPKKGLNYLPEEIKTMLKGMYKVEWHYKGRLEVVRSVDYTTRFKVNFHKARNIYKKCQDSMGFSDPAMGMKMWVESLHRPGKVITYKGKAISEKSSEVVVQTALVVSLVWDYDHFITATQVFGP